MKKNDGSRRLLVAAIGLFAVLFVFSSLPTVVSSYANASTTSAGVAVPGLALGSYTAITEVVPTVQSSSAQGVSAPLLPPSKLGCAEYVNNEWQTIACLSPEASATVPRPTEGGSAGVYGLTQSKLLTLAAVNFTLTTFSGEKDSSAGSGAFSIQANTNPFTGSNGDEDGIQYTEQSDPGGSWAYTCIWQVDITTQSYPNTCVSNPVQKLAKGYTSEVIGSADAKTKLLSVEFCVASGTCYSVTAKDMYGLAKHWTKLSGTLLGLGGGSEAEFTHPTASTAYVMLYYVGKATVFNTGPYTEETNNLNIKSNSHACYGTLVCILTSKSTN